MAKKKNIEVKIIWGLLTAIFAAFLVYPVLLLLVKSFQSDGGIGLVNYVEMFRTKGFVQSVKNSFLISGLSAVITTTFAFLMAYTIHYTNVPKGYKKAVRTLAVLPMLLPTITYGFAIIYSFGKQGLFTRIFGRQLFDIYGVSGLLTVSYTHLTLPTILLV